MFSSNGKPRVRCTQFDGDVFLPQEGLNIMHCAAINNHTGIIEYIINDLQMKELDRDDQVCVWQRLPLKQQLLPTAQDIHSK